MRTHPRVTLRRRTDPGVSTPDLDDFEPYVGDVFVADFGDDGTLDLELIEAVHRPTGNELDTSFSLVFRGPLDRVFEQTTVPVRHTSVGELAIFLVPIAEDTDGRRYEAVFTRIAE